MCVHVHVGLASILLGLLAPLVTWALWLFDRRAPRGPWKTRLLALAIGDTLLVAGLGAAKLSGLDLAAASSEPSRVGVSGAGIIDLVLLGALVVVARRRGASAAPGIAVAGGLVALSIASAATLLALDETVGPPVARSLAVLGGSTALLGTGLIALRGLRSDPSPPPQMGAPKAIALGMLYGVTGAARIAIVIALAAAALGAPLRTAADVFVPDPAWGPAGIALFLTATVAVGPLAEELVFRGVLLPWLARFMRSGAALAWTAAVFAIGHLYYGLGVLVIAHYGVLFGWARLRTGHLLAPVALHAILNFTTAMALLLAR